MNHISIYVKGSPAEVMKRLAWEAYKAGKLSQEDYVKRIKIIDKSSKN